VSLDLKQDDNNLREWLESFVYLKSDGLHKLPPSVEHQAFEVPENLPKQREIELLVELIEKMVEKLEFDKSTQTYKEQILVFSETKATVEQICELLLLKNIKNLPLHNDLKAYPKLASVFAFSTGKCPVVVSTNLGSRGLDTMKVSSVIQFDFARNVVDFIHRSGRTGRMG